MRSQRVEKETRACRKCAGSPSHAPEALRQPRFPQAGNRRHYRCTGRDDERLAFEARSMLICRKINGCHGSFRFGQSSLASSNSQLIKDQPACWNVDQCRSAAGTFRRVQTVCTSENLAIQTLREVMSEIVLQASHRRCRASTWPAQPRLKVLVRTKWGNFAGSESGHSICERMSA